MASDYANQQGERHALKQDPLKLIELTSRSSLILAPSNFVVDFFDALADNLFFNFARVSSQL